MGLFDTIGQVAQNLFGGVVQGFAGGTGQQGFIGPPPPPTIAGTIGGVLGQIGGGIVSSIIGGSSGGGPGATVTQPALPSGQIPTFVPPPIALGPTGVQTPVQMATGVGLQPGRAFQTPGDFMPIASAGGLVPDILRRFGFGPDDDPGLLERFGITGGAPTVNGMCPTGPVGATMFRQGATTCRPVRQIMVPNPMTGKLEVWEHAGRPILFTRDLTAAKRVDRIARRARGRRRPR